MLFGGNVFTVWRHLTDFFFAIKILLPKLYHAGFQPMTLSFICLYEFYEVKFAFQIFHGRRSYRELYEFTEDIFANAKNLTLSENDFGTRAAAFYLLYVLFLKQPCRPQVRIKINYVDFSDLIDWISDCRLARHWEIVYCWTKLLAEHAFIFVATTDPVGLENSGKLSNTEFRTERSVLQRRGSILGSSHLPFHQNSNFQEMLENLNKTHQSYVNMKKALSSDASSGLTIISPSFPKIVGNVIENKIENKTGNLLKEDGVTIGQRRKNLIEKSFGINAVDNPVNIDPFDETDDFDPKRKGKGKGKGKKSTSPNKNFSLNSGQDLKTMAKSLAAVQENPSLLMCLDDSARLEATKKGRKSNKEPISTENVNENGQKVKKKRKRKAARKVSKKKKIKEKVVKMKEQEEIEKSQFSSDADDL